MSQARSLPEFHEAKSFFSQDIESWSHLRTVVSMSNWSSNLRRHMRFCHQWSKTNGAFHTWGVLNSWMVYRKNPKNMDDFGLPPMTLWKPMGKSPFFSWVNQLFLWPCSSSQTVNVYQRVGGSSFGWEVVFLTCGGWPNPAPCWSTWFSQLKNKQIQGPGLNPSLIIPFLGRSLNFIVIDTLFILFDTLCLLASMSGTMSFWMDFGESSGE